VAVVGLDYWGGDGQRDAFPTRRSSDLRNWWIVHGANGDAGRRGGRCASVTGAVSERIGAVVVGSGNVGERTVAIQREQAVARAGDDRGRARVNVRDADIAQHVGGSDGQRDVFVRCVSV